MDHPELDTYNDPFNDTKPRTDEVRVGDLPLQIGQTMVFLFDFGESWEFDVTLEQVRPDVGTPIVLQESGQMPRQYR